MFVLLLTTANLPLSGAVYNRTEPRDTYLLATALAGLLNELQVRNATPALALPFTLTVTTFLFRR